MSASTSDIRYLIFFFVFLFILFFILFFLLSNLLIPCVIREYFTLSRSFRGKDFGQTFIYSSFKRDSKLFYCVRSRTFKEVRFDVAMKVLKPS